ncbi:LytR/AlgR family response regulator transcription factor [Pedobacter psychrotolerans]|uniref:LytR/AlgR family response regulator transcription factor n=1 Tax=Pedobacter psychrotolerans TaxID=1843235 RepID=UPI003F9A44B1
MEKTIPCLIIDDESGAINTLNDYITELPGISLKGTYTKAITALAALIRETVPHLVYLDIDMPGMSGITLVKSLKDSPHHIIFTTSHPDYAIEAFDLRVRHYLLKPFDLSEFAQKTNVVIQEYFQPHRIDAETDEAFMLRKNPETKRLIKVLKRDIIYIQGANNHIHFYTTGGDYSVYMTFTEIEERLANDLKFYRVQRSYIINSDQLDEVEGNTLYLKGYQVIMSPNYNASFMDWFKQVYLKTRRK